MTATIMRTPIAIPSMKRRKPGSHENDGRALIIVIVSCLNKVILCLTGRQQMTKSIAQTRKVKIRV